MTRSPEETNGRETLFGRLRTAGAPGFIASVGDLATLTVSTRAVPGHESSADDAEKWWRSALVPASLASGGFVAHAIPAYWKFDRSKSRIPLDPNVRWHYPALVAHVAFSSVAMTTTVPQLWTWLRVTQPRLHRRIGQVYIYGGVVPSSLLGLAITPYSAGPAGNAVVALGWLYTTLRGQQLARRHDYAGHRRWMMYSYGLCMHIIWGRILLLSLVAKAPQWLKEEGNLGHALETASWIGAAINLIGAQWWYERTQQRPIPGADRDRAA